MSGIRVKSEKGGALLITIIIIIALGLIGISAITFLNSDARISRFTAGERQAFYAAQSGLEYGISRFLGSDSVADWSEQLPAGNSANCDVSAEFLGGNQVRIVSTGTKNNFAKRMETLIDYEDNYVDINMISSYAVYAGGNVVNVKAVDENGVENSSLIQQNAAVPNFDLDALRSKADAVYTKGHVELKDIAKNANDGDLIFVDGDLKVSNVKEWPGQLFLVVTGKVEFTPGFNNNPKSSDLNMIIYQPYANYEMDSKDDKSPHEEHTNQFKGGIITHGSINGNTHKGSGGEKKDQRLVIEIDQDLLHRFLNIAKNKSSFTIKKMTWRTLN